MTTVPGRALRPLLLVSRWLGFASQDAVCLPPSARNSRDEQLIPRPPLIGDKHNLRNRAEADDSCTPSLAGSR
jgi:hypothetical protein